MVKWPSTRGWKGHKESPGVCTITVYISCAANAMDLVEDFLELGRTLNVTTLLQLLCVIRKRFPRRLLPNLCRDMYSDNFFPYILGVAPLPVTRTITFPVGDPYKPFLTTVTGQGPHRTYICVISLVNTQKLDYPYIGKPWGEYKSWPAHVRKNLKELLDLVSDDESGHNAQRLFWKWLDKQRWRKMMPLPFENFDGY